MNPSSSMAVVLNDYHKTSTNLRSKMLRSEEERVQLELKLHSLSTIDSRLKQQESIENTRTYFTQLNQESQRAQERNAKLLNDLTQVEHNLNQLRINTEHLISVKLDYLQYLESKKRDKHKHASNSSSPNRSSYDLDRLRQQQSEGNVRITVLTNHTTHDADPSTSVKRHDDQLKNGSDHHQDDQSISEATSNTFSHSKRAGSLRMELSRPGLYFLLDYIEKELKDTIDKKKFYHHDPPTITQKRTILDIANERQQYSLKDLDPATTSMVILDQLSSTIRRTTANKCLLTDDILSANIQDLDKNSITKMLPELDRVLWTRLIDHFTRLLKFHIMTSETLANKFATTFLPNNALYLHDKAKSLIKHIVDKQQSSSDEETASDRKQPGVIGSTTSLSTLLNRITYNGGMDEDISSSSSTATLKKTIKSPSSTPRANIHQDDSDLEFYS